MLELLLRSQLPLGLRQCLSRGHAILPPELIKGGHQKGSALVRHRPERADGSGGSAEGAEEGDGCGAGGVFGGALLS